MLDEYLEGSVERISPEAPIPVVNLINKERDVRLGGAANVFNNLISLGGKDIYLCGVIGNDRNGDLIREKLYDLGAETGGLVLDADRPTTVKTRIIAHNQQVIRLDREERAPISPASQSYLLSFMKDRLGALDAIIFSDYEKGVINGELLEKLLPIATQQNVIIAVDPKFSNFKYFTKTTIIIPNRKEASVFFRHEISDDHDALSAARYILDRLDCECVLLKMGELGMRLVEKKGSDIVIKTAAEQVYDVTGAGDTVISTLVLAKTAGASWEEAARIANIAAGIVIHYVGTSTVTADQLKRAILDKKIPGS